jgi:hypothetical protein
MAKAFRDGFAVTAVIGSANEDTKIPYKKILTGK